MRIDYLSASELISDSANSVHVVRMSAAFAGLGHAVTLHAFRGGGDDAAVRAHYDAPATFEIERYGRDDGLLVRAIAQARRVGLPTGPAQRLAIGRFAVRHRVREGGLLVARNSEWLLACLRPRSRFVFETHDPPRGLRDRLITDRVLEHPGLKALVVISRPLRDAWAAARPQIASRILVAPDGADAVADPDGSAAQPRDATAPFRVGYVGHLYPGRGGELLVDVARTVPEAEFHLVGGRPEDVARLRGLAPPPNVIFHGHRPPSEVPTLMRRFDAVVAPYQAKVAVSGGGGDTVAWMSPLKIFEYMSHAKPIVVSDLPVLHEALERDRTALFVPASDVSAWADALRRLMRDPDERQALGRRAHETFLARYTWSRRAARILEAAGATS